MTERAYFDWNATTPLRKEAREAMDAALGLTGNASSVHAEGRAARRLIEQAREDVARLVGAESRNVTFTSGATEANTLVLTPAIEIGGRREPRDRLFISAVEHTSVLSGGLSVSTWAWSDARRWGRQACVTTNVPRLLMSSMRS